MPIFIVIPVLKIPLNCARISEITVKIPTMEAIEPCGAGAFGSAFGSVGTGSVPVSYTHLTLPTSDLV